MIIANALKDGLVVFLADNGRWVTSIDEGALADSPEEAEKLAETAKQAEAANEVIGPELIEIELSDDGRRPVEIREFIRANGPSVHGHPDE